jgi:glucose/arabinose dehydrogenase
MNRLARLASAAFVCLSLAACRGDSPDGGSDQTPLRGGERLGWNQPAASVQELRALTYRLYVDGTLGAFADVRCEETLIDGGYECSGRLPAMTPGRHVLQMSAVLDGIETERSDPLTVEVAASSMSVATDSVLSRADSPTDAPGTACIGTSGHECYEIRVVASGIGTADALRSTSDGRLFFVEDGSRVRVVVRDTLLAEPAVTFDDPDSHIVGLAVDSHFSRTRSVFVAWTENDPASGSHLNITRYREVAGTFGEGARIVTGLPFAGSTNVATPMAVDGDGLLYIAMAAAIDARATRSPSGTVLRVTRDGLVPDGNRLASPIVVEGYARPAGLAIDVPHGRVWMTGHDPAWRHSVASFTSASSSLRGAAVDDGPFKDPLSAGSIALAQAAAPGETARLLIVAGAELYEGLLAPDGRLTAVQNVRFDLSTAVLDVAEGPNGSWYVLTSADDRSTTLLKLERR